MKSAYKESAFPVSQSGTRETPSVKTNRRRPPSDNRSARISDSIAGMVSSRHGLSVATSSEQGVIAASSRLGGFVLSLDKKSVTVNILRELETPELVLLRSVIAKLGYSTKVNIDKKRNAKQIVVEYYSAVPQNVITTLCTLITGLETTYSGPANRNKLNDQSSSSDEGLDLDFQSSEQALQQPSDPQSGASNPDTATSVSPTKTLESEEAENGVFERPLSLKGQRHIFLYKCRYNKLKTIIDACGCWDLRVSSLDEKWPCLLVYCAKSKDIWRNAFKRISKLEKSRFLRRKISDSMQSVDMRNLEYYVASYGQKYALGPRIPS